MVCAWNISFVDKLLHVFFVLHLGWNYTRLSDVSLQRHSANGAVLNSANLITSTGCVHPAMQSICPEPPVFEQPLGYRFGFRAVMFQGMKSGDEMVISVKILGCLHQIDCFVVSQCHRHSDFITRYFHINAYVIGSIDLRSPWNKG